MADIERQREMRALENITAVDAVMFGDRGIDGADDAANEIVDGVILEIDGARRHAGFLHELARQIEEHVRFRMIDRVHEAAAPRPTQQVFAELEPELLSLRE